MATAAIKLVRQIGFDDAGVGATIFSKGKLESGMFVLADSFTSNMPTRYKLVDGKVTDAYEGKTDDEVIATNVAAEAEEAKKRAANKRRTSKLTLLDYYALFTAAELNAIYTAAATNVDVKIVLDLTQMAQEIFLTDPRVAAGIKNLEALKLLTPNRAKAILAGELPA